MKNKVKRNLKRHKYLPKFHLRDGKRSDIFEITNETPFFESILRFYSVMDQKGFRNRLPITNAYSPFSNNPKLSIDVNDLLFTIERKLPVYIIIKGPLIGVFNSIDWLYDQLNYQGLFKDELSIIKNRQSIFVEKLGIKKEGLNVYLRLLTLKREEIWK